MWDQYKEEKGEGYGRMCMTKQKCLGEWSLFKCLTQDAFFLKSIS